MRLGQVLIRKEEIPIYEIHTGSNEHKPYFKLPIHPIFTSDKIQLDQSLAQKLFPKVVDEWYEDLKIYALGLEPGNAKDWINSVFLDEKPYVTKKYGNQYIGPRETWKDHVSFLKNGFAFYFELERDTAGSIGVHFGDFNGIITHIGPGHVKFTPEKFAEYNAGRDLKKKTTKEEIEKAKNGVRAYVFGHHNVEIYPGALLLRNWGIEYQNEALKSLKKSGFL